MCAFYERSRLDNDIFWSCRTCFMYWSSQGWWVEVCIMFGCWNMCLSALLFIVTSLYSCFETNCMILSEHGVCVQILHLKSLCSMQDIFRQLLCDLNCKKQEMWIQEWATSFGLPWILIYLVINFFGYKYLKIKRMLYCWGSINLF